MADSHGASDYVDDPTAFLYTLYNNNSYYPEKMVIARASGDNALYDTRKYGPTFGGGHDINIRNMAWSNSDSYYLCSTYKCSSFPLTDSQKYFTPNDAEVLYETNY
ncbi:hypothetical protein OS493_019500 [Desmophyllum pertusum]|uniref:Uncharacterized protein n=1 Tax=Desmophyllum pertusum TaxID=174260 RepID=A0A9X0D3Y2_9CNID|nr:hypothetical protein OS493_019500 [Desmophyllum pertusum]